MMPAKIGRYEIKTELGRGGMAIVYLANDPRFDREVAIKVLPREFLFDEQFRTRFEREIKLVAQLEHPAIVPVHDVGEDDGQPYFVMRNMTGGSLSDWLKQGSFSLQDTARIVERLCRGLAYAHNKGIVHRDLKPANILFDANGDACISDFGVAKLAEAASTMTGSGVIGTPAYMSPEQAQSGQVDARSDVYAMGAIVYEMLTGQQPFKADTPMGVVIKHITDPVPDILQGHAEFPPELGVVIQTAMHKDVDKRYASMLELAKALNKVTFGDEGQFTAYHATRPNFPAVPASSVAPTIAPATPLPPLPKAEPIGGKGMLWLGGIIGAIVVLALVTAIIFLLRDEPVEIPPPITVAPTWTAFVITATPLPVTETPPPTITPTFSPATALPTPDFDAVLLTPGQTHEGTTQTASNMLAFYGKEDQIVKIVLTGVNNYQTFSIRNQENDGLIGCITESQVICAIRDFKLPYTGLYYVLVDRTADPRYANAASCKTGLAPVWCFISGPYSITVSMK